MTSPGSPAGWSEPTHGDLERVGSCQGSTYSEQSQADLFAGFQSLPWAHSEDFLKVARDEFRRSRGVGARSLPPPVAQVINGCRQ